MPKKQDPLENILKELSEETNIKSMVLEKLGYNTKIAESIEDMFQDDVIQARIPFIIELK